MPKLLWREILEGSFDSSVDSLVPWRPFARMIAIQAFWVALIAVPSLALALSKHLWLAWAVGFAGFLGFVGLSLRLGRGIAEPLARVMRKAQSLVEGEGSPDRTLSGDEWDNLESVLERAKNDLRSKSEIIARDEEELSILMGALSDAILAVDLDGKPLFYNPRFALMFVKREQAKGAASLRDLFSVSELLDSYDQALAGAGAQSIRVNLPVHTEGQERYFSISIAPLRREGGAVYGAIGVFHDVTELKRAEQIRIDFVANVSHELRTPLTSIKGYTDTLLSDAREQRWDAAPRFLEVISRNVDRLMNLIQDLLDLSWLESGSELQCSEVDPRDATNRVLSQIEALRAAKGHQIEATYSIFKVRADARRLEQVLVNLLENAIKYVPPGGGRIRISWEPFESGVRLRITDNGPGIPAEHQSRLFERFYRVDKARSREMGGTGLGLAIVKHILQAHGGTVTVLSEVGQGSEFVCQFPNSPEPVSSSFHAES